MLQFLRELIGIRKPRTPYIKRIVRILPNGVAVVEGFVEDYDENPRVRIVRPARYNPPKRRMTPWARIRLKREIKLRLGKHQPIPFPELLFKHPLWMWEV